MILNGSLESPRSIMSAASQHYTAADDDLRTKFLALPQFGEMLEKKYDSIKYEIWVDTIAAVRSMVAAEFEAQA